ncbi:hypothetical protein, partial [Actinoallomurus acaciae]
SLAEQLRHVERWWDRDQRDDAARDAILWGTSMPSAIETAASARRGDDDFATRLADAAADLGNIDGLLSLYLPHSKENNDA